MKTPDRDERELLAPYREGERMPAAIRDGAWSRLQAAIHDDGDAANVATVPERRGQR